MTSNLRAKLVLADSRRAIEMLAGCPPEDESWRVCWVAALALLRSVGHVLDKVDAEQDEVLRAVCDKWWANLKANKEGNEVFWEIIDKERNYMLKEYETGAEWFVDFYEVVDNEGNNIVTESGDDVLSTDVNLCMVSLTNGIKTAGDDALTVLARAYDWWVAQLDEIEAQLK